MARILQRTTGTVNPYFQTGRWDSSTLEYHSRWPAERNLRSQLPPGPDERIDDAPGLPPGASALPGAPAWGTPCVAPGRNPGKFAPTAPFPGHGSPWQ